MKVVVGIRRGGAQEREAQWPVPLCERLHGTVGCRAQSLKLTPAVLQALEPPG